MLDEESSNPFAATSEEYVEKRELQLKKQKTEKISAQRKQINEVKTINTSSINQKAQKAST